MFVICEYPYHQYQYSLSLYTLRLCLYYIYIYTINGIIIHNTHVKCTNALLPRDKKKYIFIIKK